MNVYCPERQILSKGKDDLVFASILNIDSAGSILSRC